MTRIFVVKGKIYCYQFKCKNLKHQRHFCAFLLFLESKLNLKHFEKKIEPHTLSISEIIDSERCGY